MAETVTISKVEYERLKRQQETKALRIRVFRNKSGKWTAKVRAENNDKGKKQPPAPQPPAPQVEAPKETTTVNRGEFTCVIPSDFTPPSVDENNVREIDATRVSSEEGDDSSDSASDSSHTDDADANTTLTNWVDAHLEPLVLDEQSSLSSHSSMPPLVDSSSEEENVVPHPGLVYCHINNFTLAVVNEWDAVD
eukprot:TRINITY_DN61831_c0_g1_i1.p1 TRINITY_DN61831_c0_g1~~TRINITY_DN61831_c0_g1_i1.p1  ORF type:complete len:194 (-),score=41.74 TRINITY_DN61831_c0_g1_i1:447-1028(-)